MPSKVGVRELRQNLSKYLAQVKDGETFDVTERGQVVARLSPAGGSVDPYARLSALLGVKPPTGKFSDIREEFLTDRPQITTEEFDELMEWVRGERRD